LNLTKKQKILHNFSRSFEGNKDKKMAKKEEREAKKQQIDLIHEQTGLGKRNIDLTYMKNQYGKDKSKMLNVLTVGSMCAKAGIKKDQLQAMIDFTEKMREIDGTSKK
jgi:hypothetical protein